MNIEKEEEVLKLLEGGKKSTTEISAKIKWNHWNTLELLEEIKTQGKIFKIEENKYVY